jgi:UTP--glucose-1-phosphate uridylyltransferase
MTEPTPLFDTIPPEARELLHRYRFGAATFEGLAATLRERGVVGMTNRIEVPVEPPAPSDLRSLARPGSDEYAALREQGLRAIREGRFAAAVLNGGMATRFGGVVKGVVEARPGRSFLQLQAEHLRQLGAEAGAPIPLLLMNSFATAEATEVHLAETGRLGLGDDLRTFEQTVAPRLTPAAELFRTDEGQVSLYGPGHGDFASSLRAAGLLDWLESRGVRYVSLCNVDNLGARPDPVILGHHLAGGNPLTVELVDKDPGDKGGAPAMVDGHLEIVEDFRFPADFDSDRIPVFNTNTFVFDLPALTAEHPLDWFTVVKNVQGRQAVQFERLVGQLTAFEDATYLRVPRERFLPVKRPEDLTALQPTLAAIFG